MGMRFRKSINLGGGFRINLSKSGIGYSWGVPGYRITKTAKGTVRKTTSIPGTGIFWVEEHKVQQNNGPTKEKKGGSSVFGFVKKQKTKRFVENWQEQMRGVGTEIKYDESKNEIQLIQPMNDTTQGVIEDDGLTAYEYKTAVMDTMVNSCAESLEYMRSEGLDADLVFMGADSEGSVFARVKNGNIEFDLIYGEKRKREEMRRTKHEMQHISCDATEIMEFKKLLDQGIITEEEFTAKKRQLLGL